jgi:hypothetical protein
MKSLIKNYKKKKKKWRSYYYFEEFIKHKCLLCTCITNILISSAVTTVISIDIMGLILMGIKEIY